LVRAQRDCRGQGGPKKKSMVPVQQKGKTPTKAEKTIMKSTWVVDPSLAKAKRKQKNEMGAGSGSKREGQIATREPTAPNVS